MRVRLLGQFVPASVALLAFIEAALAFLALYAAASIRFDVGMGDLPTLEEQYGPLWPRGVAFSAIVVGCLLAFGLYNSRQRVQLSGILARVLVALVVSSCATAALFYVVPSLHLGRGVAGLAVLLVLCGVFSSTVPGRPRPPLPGCAARPTGRASRWQASCSRRASHVPLPLNGCSTPREVCQTCAAASASRRSWWPWTTGAAAFRSRSCSTAGWRVSRSPRCSLFSNAKPGACASIC